jgi:hypothetical protein
MPNNNSPILTDYDAILQYINDCKPHIIAIDGRDGSGKSYLATELHKQLGGTLLKEDDYREADLIGHFVPKFVDLIRDLRGKKPVRPIIYESCFVQAILPQIGVKADLVIYIKNISAMGLWSDEDELAYLVDETEAVKQAKSMGANPFRIQMIEYHYRFKPHEKADVIYHRAES